MCLLLDYNSLQIFMSVLEEFTSSYFNHSYYLGGKKENTAYKKGDFDR